MRMREVRVSFGLTVNAGDYSNERVEVSLTGELEPGDVSDARIRELLTLAKAHVLAELKKSMSWRVRKFAEGPDVADAEDTPF